ncbi:MAG: hypothetical protein KGZ59_00895 [Chitinophagaceae bacterium]|nr:hypothetical protein [Chitinophagaceae bacterium]
MATEKGRLAYKRSDYTKGIKEYNLLLNQRHLLIKALLRTKWRSKQAYYLNFEGSKYVVSYSGYLHLLKRHHISVLTKSFKKISELPK